MNHMKESPVTNLRSWGEKRGDPKYSSHISNRPKYKYPARAGPEKKSETALPSFRSANPETDMFPFRKTRAQSSSHEVARFQKDQFREPP